MRCSVASLILLFALLVGLGFFIPRVYAAPTTQLGDVDYDGDVDGTDLTLFLGYFGNSDTRADVDGDGEVTIFDYNTLVSHYGEGSSTDQVRFSMTFYNTALTQTIVCAYPAISIQGRELYDTVGGAKIFTSQVLDWAESCGTKVGVFLSDKTENVIGDHGGLDLARYEDVISFYDGKIDPYVDRGVLVAHGVVDEPHDCHDWQTASGEGDCPTASDVDEAGRISKEHWPMLETAVNTIPSYAGETDHEWQYVDIFSYQWAFHKYRSRGGLPGFISEALAYLASGKTPQIAWAIQAMSGGGANYQECSMTADQVRYVASEMCGTALGEWFGYVLYDDVLLATPGMGAAIEAVRSACAGGTLVPGVTPGVPPPLCVP